MTVRLLPVLALLLLAITPARAEPPYRGPLYDAHAHLSNRASIETAHRHLTEAGFEKMVLFVDAMRIDKAAKTAPGHIRLFADPFKRKTSKQGGKNSKKTVRYRFQKKRLAKIEAALKSGKAVGFGEIYIHLGYAPFASEGIHTPIDDKGVTALFKVAKQYRAPVQIHHDPDYADELERLLADNRDVSVILAHCGYSRPDALSGLMDRHPNLYAETSLIFNPWIPKFADPPLKDGTLRQDWKNLMLRHADRLMMGTDYAGFRPEQAPKLNAYYREILGHLPTDVAEKIAYRNFQRLFEK